MPRDAELAAEFEQIVLNFRQAGANIVGYCVDGQNDTDSRISLVNRAVRLYARRILRDTTAVTESCRAVVTGPCIDFAKSVSYIQTIGRRLRGVKKRRLFLGTAAAIVAPSFRKSGSQFRWKAITQKTHRIT